MSKMGEQAMEQAMEQDVGDCDMDAEEQAYHEAVHDVAGFIKSGSVAKHQALADILKEVEG